MPAVKGVLEGRIHPVEDMPGVLVQLDPPAHPEYHGRAAHLTVEGVHRSAWQHALHMRNRIDDELASLFTDDFRCGLVLGRSGGLRLVRVGLGAILGGRCNRDQTDFD
jgi:hypothetical protein